MLKGHNLIGFTESATGNDVLTSFSTVDQQILQEKFKVATNLEIEEAIEKATAAFKVYRHFSAERKAVFLETIGQEILALGDLLIQRAMLETGLPEGRLVGERGRTVGQLKLFAELLREGSWVEAVIDPALPDRKPLPRADIRKMSVPIGPVVVFCASNFPFAFSTAGGDTASALAAGNPVIVKAHSSHLGTNELVASAINKAAQTCGMPNGIFSFVIGSGNVTGMKLVKHPDIKAVGFTGSFNGGMAIYKAAINERATPIPVYAEMSSINPVLVLPNKIKSATSAIASQLANSITLGAGQFCTNPGLLFLIDNESSSDFIKQLTDFLGAVPAATMLNPAIAKSYYHVRKEIAGQDHTTTLFNGDDLSESYKASPGLMLVKSTHFITNPKFHQEMFGPASLVILCENKEALDSALASLHGQLTASVFATEDDLQNFASSVDIISDKVGRILFNGVPTGVEVCHAMIHGGPFPATTDAKSTSVGADAIKRFVRPLCFQDCPEALLPVELRNNNPSNIIRKINGAYSRDQL